MRNGKKWISLLLIAVMALMLLPTTAYAYPPDDDTPTHRHNWAVTYQREPTCDEAGVTTWTCSLCGKEYTEYPPALGHVWDDGVVTTEPYGFTPGVITYTCRRDSSHTRTEELEGLAVVFDWLHGVDFSSMTTHDLPPLVITEQPQGGAVTRGGGESHTMHVTASGGTGEYFYEWHAASQDLGKSEQYNDMLKQLFGFLGVTPEQIDEILDTSFSDTDTCTVDLGGQDYYCVVSDSAGNSVSSENARVGYKLRIVQQPRNVNWNTELDEDTQAVYLECKAADGSGEYSYEWYFLDLEGPEGEIPIDIGERVPVTDMGRYFCVVTDTVTGDTVTSDEAVVYEAEPFKIQGVNAFNPMWPEEEAELAAWCTGGVPPYEVWWDHNGTPLNTQQGADKEGCPAFYATSTAGGVYTAHATDSMGATDVCAVVRYDKHLNIAQQPVGGTIPKDGHTEISVVMADGEAPYTYSLYRNGKLDVQSTEYDTSSTFAVWFPGNYYFHIEDSEGHTVDSDVVYFEDAVFRITTQSEAEQITSPGGSTALFVEAEGGMEPYTYSWTWTSGDNTYDLGRNADLIPVFDIGEYTCVIEDDAGQRITSKPMQVTYGGEAPWIVVQPQSQTDLTLNADGTVDAALFCNAISGTGDKSDLKYVWEIFIPGEIGWAQTTTTGQWLDVHTLGSYRCRVVDTVTGKYTYSDTALVCEKLAYQGSESWYTYHSDCMNYHFTFTGGVGPYTVKVYQNIDTDLVLVGGMRQALYKTETVNSAEELKSYQVFVPVRNDVIREEDGELRRYSEYSEYFVVVIDASGQTCESEVRGLLRDLNR